MTNTYTCLAEGKLPTFIRTIFQEEFQKQELKLHHISIRNFEITKKEMA